ncbi:urea transporter, partial [Staphylococcus aureus]|nr:urea transporter [Staphylococcus aureus]
FLDKSGLDIVITMIATLLTLPVAAAVREVLRPYKVPMLTMPFIIVALLGGNYDDINQGLFGYNFVLMAIALGYTFKTAINPYISTFLGVLLTVVVQLGTTTLLEPFGLPALTLPFIIVTWILLFAGIKHDKVDA